MSTPELDAMVDIAMGVKGVYGSRMTGGGFGGSTVLLIDRGRARAITEQLQTDYRKQTGLEPSIFLTSPSRGAKVI